MRLRCKVILYIFLGNYDYDYLYLYASDLLPWLLGYPACLGRKTAAQPINPQLPAQHFVGRTGKSGHPTRKKEGNACMHVPWSLVWCGASSPSDKDPAAEPAKGSSTLCSFLRH